MFPKSAEMRAWMKNDGVWLFQGVGCVLALVGYNWLVWNRGTSPQVAPILVTIAGFGVSVYGAIYWCVSVGQRNESRS